MSKITRKTMKIFGSSAGANQIAKFGSLNAGSPAFTTDPDTIQSLSNYLVGWYNAVVGGNSPAIEDMNALFYLYAYQLAYLFQEGIPEWDSATTYYIGSIAQDGSGNIYVSLQDNNTGNALSSATYWRAVNYASLPRYNIPVGDVNSTTQEVNTNLVGSYLASYNTGTFTVTIATPAVISYSSHGFITGDRLYFTTTGALPTGLSQNVAYFVIRTGAGTFNVATTYANAIAGTAINTTGTQSGVHTALGGGINPIQGSQSNPFTAIGDIGYSANTTGVLQRLGIGSTGDLGTVVAGLPAWTSTITGNKTLATCFMDGSASTSGYKVEIARASPSSADSQNLYSGTYTPTLTAGAGTITPGTAWRWFRIGNMVTVFGYAATSAGVTASVMTFSLPITPAAFSATFGIAATQLQGTLFQNDTHVQISGNSGNTNGVTVNNIGAGVTALYFHFSYSLS